MAYFQISDVSLVGIAAVVPKNSVSNFDLQDIESEERKKLIQTLGIENRRVAVEDQCASDLCIEAANKLIEELGWNKDEIEVLFFVTQTPDYHLPGTSLHMQERLGLPKSCVTFDINQGCAGYVYGLSLITSFMASSRIKKGLLLVGDTITKLISPFDKSLVPIFSDCGTATAMQHNSNAKTINFNINSEGANYDSIIVPHGGMKNRISKNSFDYVEYSKDIKRQGIHLAMKGLDVFNFSLKKVAPNVVELLSKSGQIKDEIDFFIFHQANKLILESISKKLNIESNKVPGSLKDFGNTSGATIPLTIVTNLRRNNKIMNSRLVLSGFGVGLSLASTIICFDDVICPDLIET